MTTQTNTAPSPSVVVHIDGSCIGNPGPGGWAFVFQTFEDGREAFKFHVTGGDPVTTNSRMEMTAAIKAFRFLSGLAPHIPATIVSDSQFLCKGVNEWLSGWKARDWRKSDGKPVANGALWVELDDLQAHRPVEWRWTRGHVGTALNEEVDSLANAEARKWAEMLAAPT